MINELILLSIALFDFAAIAIATRFGKEIIAVLLFTNMFLISIFGAELITLFGATTTAGNVFFAAAFLIIQLLCELYGRHYTQRIIWFVALALLFVIIMTQLTILLVPTLETKAISDALSVVFFFAPRIAIASITAYIISTNINVWIFDLLKKRRPTMRLYQRSGTATIVGQCVDSVIFFSLAFWGTVAPLLVLESIVIGVLIKSAVGIAAIPVLSIAILIGKELKERVV